MDSVRSVWIISVIDVVILNSFWANCVVPNKFYHKNFMRLKQKSYKHDVLF